MRHSRLYVSVFLCFLFISLSAQDIINIPESCNVRSRIRDSWLELPVQALSTKAEEEFEDIDGSCFQVRYEDYGDDSLIIVAPQKLEKVEVYSDSGVEQVLRKIYPSEAPGSWILFRDSKTGEAECIRFYFDMNTEVFIQFRKSPGIPTEKSLADVFVFGEYAARDVPVGIPLDYFYDMSRADVLSLLKYVVPWVTKPFYSSLYNDIFYMSSEIRKILPRVHLHDDAAYDEKGNLISINTGEAITILDADESSLYVSSAGFVKWIVDGLVRPISGNGILRDSIVKETEVFKEGSLSDRMAKNYDTTLALNWTRNLAAAMVSIYSGGYYTYDTSGVQLASVPFNGAYIESTGFKISMMKSIFYYLAATEPGRFYLGAIRQIEREEAEFVVYKECVAFFPAFDKNGKFSVAVFINGKEVKIEDFMREYAGDFIQLVRIQSSEQFEPLGK